MPYNQIVYPNNPAANPLPAYSPLIPTGLVAPTSGITGVGTGNVTATSVGTGGFGRSPNLTPEQLRTFNEGMGRIMYSYPAGGYIMQNRRGPGQQLDPYYKGGGGRYPEGTGGDPNANRIAEQLYGMVGNAPTVPNMTAALRNLYASTGRTPTLGPSLNEMLAPQGVSYHGPYETVEHNWDALRRRYGIGETYHPGSIGGRM